MNPDKIQQAIQNDVLIQNGLVRIADINQQSFSALYGLQDGIRKTSSEVAELLQMPEADVILREMRAIATLGEHTFRRLMEILAGREVESPESIQARLDEAADQRENLRQIIRRFSESTDQNLSKKDAQILWDSLSGKEQLLLFLRDNLKLSFAKIGTRLEMHPNTIQLHYRNIARRRFSRNREIVDAMMRCGVIRDPGGEKS